MPTPQSSSPSRRPISIMSTLSVIGRPRRRSKHDVEVRVARVAVVDGVAGETTSHEQLVRERRGVGGPDLRREHVERAEPRGDVDRVVVRGDEERGFVERDLVVGLLHDGREPLRDVHARTVPARRGATGPTPTLARHDRARPAPRRRRPCGCGEQASARTPNRNTLVRRACARAGRPLTIPEILDAEPGLAQSSALPQPAVARAGGRRASHRDERRVRRATSSPRTSPVTTITT